MADGETPIVAVMCQVAFGADRLERSPEEIEQLFRFLPGGVREKALGLLRAEPPQRQEGPWEKALGRVLDAISGDLVKGEPDEWIGGVAAAGHVGSAAHRLAAALKGETPCCVVTNRRLVFARHDYGNDSFTELASLPRRAVLAARRSGRFLQRGRVVLDFVDLSQLALMTGILFTGSANRLVSALNGGVVRDGHR